MGPDGALWFTLNQANAIGRITVSGQVRLHPLPTPGAKVTEHPLADPDGEPHGLAFGPDGTLYVAEERDIVVSRWEVPGAP